MEGLKVKIKKIFREELERRFDIESAKYNNLFERYEINVACTFCNYYSCVDFALPECPFKRFMNEGPTCAGCANWMLKITGYKRIPFRCNWTEIYWRKRHNKEARKFLVLLKEQAEKYIGFVD